MASDLLIAATDVGASHAMLSVLAVLIMAGAFVQSTTGFGFALVASPALFAALEPGEAVVASIALGLVLNLLLLFGERRGAEVRGADVARLAIAAVPGVLLGALVLSALPRPALQVLVGVVVIAAGVLQAGGLGGFRSAAQDRGGYLVGLLAGGLTTSTGVNGPPVALWMSSRGLEGGALRDSCAAVLLCLGLLGAGTLALFGTLTFPALTVPWALVLLAAAVGGHYAGRQAFLRLGVGGHARAVLGLVLVSGTAILIEGAFLR